MTASAARPPETCDSACRVRFAVWKPLNNVCVAVNPTACGVNVDSVVV